MKYSAFFSNFYSIFFLVILATTLNAQAPNHQSPLGTNLPFLKSYGQDYPFTDAFKFSREWISNCGGCNWNEGGPLLLDSLGWVTGFPEAHPDSVHYAQTIIMDGAFDKPTGTYHLFWEGEGEVDIIGDIEEKRVIDDHHWEVDVVDGDFGFWFYVWSSDPEKTGDYIRNVRFVMPGYENTYETEIFQDRFLKVLENYSTIRFMDWGETNFSPLETWAQRTTPQHQTQSRDEGVAIEYMVELSNVLEADMWYCIPHAADDDYVRKAAELIKEKLHPDRKLYLEYSNEVWNFAFGQFGYCYRKGEELGLTEMGNFAAEYYALRVGQIFDIFTDVFGETEQLQRVIAWQNYNVYWTAMILDYKDNPSKTDAVAIAPYFGGITGKPDNLEEEKNKSITEVLDYSRHKLAYTMDGILGQIKVATDRNLPLLAYEGGQHLAGVGAAREDTTLTNLMTSTNRAPGMKDVYLDYFERWKLAGGQLFMHFNSMGGYGKFGSWGSLESYAQDARLAPKYAAQQEFIENNTPAWWYNPSPTPTLPEGDLLIRFDGLDLDAAGHTITENRTWQQPVDSILYIPFSTADGDEIFTTNNTQTTFYGGIKLDYLADTVSYLEYGLANYGEHDAFKIRTGPAHSDGILLWRKDQFLNGQDATEKVTLGKLKMNIRRSYGGGNEAEFRFVVKNGTQYYISDYMVGNTQNKFIELDFFNNSSTPTKRWYPFDPTNLKIPFPVLPGPVIFDDVTEVGFLFNLYRDQFDTFFEFTGFEAYTRSTQEFNIRLDKSATQVSPTLEPKAQFTAIFSEPTTDFTLSDIVLSGTAIDENSQITLAEITPFDGTIYEITVTELIGNGSIKVDIPKAAATNTNGFPNQAATAINPIVVFAGADPATVTLNQAVGQEDPTLYTPIHFTAVFSKPIIGFDTSAIISTGTATPQLKVITEIAPFDSTTFDIALADFDTSGIVSIRIPSEVASLPDFAVGNIAAKSIDNSVLIEVIPDRGDLINFRVIDMPYNSDLFIHRNIDTLAEGYTRMIPFGTTDTDKIYEHDAYNQAEFYGGVQIQNKYINPPHVSFNVDSREGIEIISVHEGDNQEHFPGNIDLLFLWRKDQFLNNMHLPQVGFNNDSAQSALEISTIQMNGAADLRFVIRNGSAYYFSEPLLTEVDTLGWTENQDFPLPPFQLTAFNNSNEAGKRWANFTPTATDFFLPENPVYQPMNFDDVTEVGFLYKSVGYKKWYLNGFFFDTFKVNGITKASCQTSQTLSAPESINRVVNTSQFITSTATILSAKDITYEAGENIRLLPGFTATAGSNFVAKIADCPSPENSEETTFISTFPPTKPIENSPNNTLVLNIYPNPFTSSAIIDYVLPTTSSTKLSLWNLEGHLLKEWQLGEQEKGQYQMSIQKKDLSTGMYFLRLQTGTDVLIKKVILSE